MRLSRTSSRPVVRWALVLVTTLLLQGAAELKAQTAPPEAGAAGQPAAAPEQPWILNCSNQGSGSTLRCSMTQTIVARETGQRVISAVIFRNLEPDALRLTLGLPHGLDLPAGVSLRIDEDPPLKAEIKTADQNGSYSTLDLSPQFLARLKAGSILNVGVTAASGGEVMLQLSLTGFSAAIDKV